MQELARLGGCHLLILSRYSLQISDWEIVLEINNISFYLNHKDLTCRAENAAGPAEDSVMLNITCEQSRRGWGEGCIGALAQEPTQLCLSQFPP